MRMEAAIGPGKKNLNQHVLIVRALFNLRYREKKICGIDELVLDGVWGKGTLAAIRSFQAKTMGQQKPSGEDGKASCFRQADMEAFEINTGQRAAHFLGASWP
jgi:hypothetical protein